MIRGDDSEVDRLRDEAAREPLSPAVHAGLALALARAGRIRDAADEMAMAAALDPQHAAVLHGRTGALYLEGSPDDEALDLAEAHLDRALALGDPDPDTRYRRAHVALRRGDPRTARRLLEEVALDQSAPAHFLEDLASLLEDSLEDAAQRAALLARVALGAPGDARLHLGWAHAAATAHDFPSALVAAGRALDLAVREGADGIARAAARIASTALVALGRPDEAEATWRALPVHVDRDLGLAESVEAQGHLERAAGILDESIALNAADPRLRMERARLGLSLGEPGLALRQAATALDLDPVLAPRVDALLTRWNALWAAIPDLLARCGLGAPVPSARGVRVGHNNLSAVVACGGRDLFVKACFETQRSEAQVAYSQEVLRWLGERNVPVPRSIAEPDGRASWAVPGAGLVTIHGRLDGRPLPRPAPGAPRRVSVDEAHRLGALLAGLHLASSPVPDALADRPSGGMRAGLAFLLDPAPRASLPSSLGVDAAFPALLEKTREGGDVLSAMDRLGAALRPRLPGFLRCVIHGDFGAHNVLWDDGMPVGLVDFDYACADVAMADLANAVHRTALSWRTGLLTGDPGFRPEVARALLAGYDEVRPRSGDERCAFGDVLSAVRIPYYLSMAVSGLQAGGEPASGLYPDALQAVRVLSFQLRWLAKHPVADAPGEG